MSKKIVANKIIYTNSMNMVDLSKLSKDELIDMLLEKQTASAKKAGPVFKPKSLTQ